VWVCVFGGGRRDVVAGQLSVCSIMIISEIKNFVSLSLFVLFLIYLFRCRCLPVLDIPEGLSELRLGREDIVRHFAF
jgi:hypothetical protein